MTFLKKIGWRGWLAAAVVVTASVIAWRVWFAGNGSPATRVASVERGDISVSVQANGTVRPRNRLEVKPPLAGRAEDVLVAEGQIVKRGDVLAWMSSNERAALLDAARAKGADEVKRWSELYRPTAIVSPISGTVIQRTIEPGQSFVATDSLLVIADRLIVEAPVDETDIAQVRTGQAVTLILDSYPEQALESKVESIAFEAKAVNNVITYVVDVKPERVPSFMRSGMTASVQFHTQRRTNVLWLPAQAVMRRNGEGRVRMAGEMGAEPEERVVKIGISDGRRVEIVSGLTEGQSVLVPQVRAPEKKSGANPLSGVGGPPARPPRRPAN